MADNSKKISELATASNVASTDRVLVLRSPASNASVRTVTASNLANSIVTLLPTLIPNSTVVSNSVTITSNGTTPVSFYTFDGDSAQIKFHAVDSSTGDITAGEIFCAANNTNATSYVTVADVGNNKIRFDSTPTVNATSGIVTMYMRRDSAATSNVLIKYAALYY